MKGPLYILIALLTIACGAGCSRRQADTLAIIDRVDSLVDVQPDSALMLLRSIDSALLSSPELRARHALAMSRALDKNYIDTTDCSIVDVAVDYYSDHSDPRRLMLALFYQGTVLRNDHQYNRAVISAMQANELAIQLADDYWTAKTYELLADIHGETYNRAEALLNYQKAAHYYKLADRPTNHIFSLIDVAIAYTNQCDYSKNLKLTDSLLSIIPPSEKTARAWCIKAQIVALLQTHQLDRALKCLNDLEYHYGDQYVLSSKDHSHKAQIYSQLNQFEEAKEEIYNALTLSVTPDDTIEVYNAKFLHHINQGSSEQALKVVDSLLTIHNNIVARTLNLSPVKYQRDHIQKQYFISEKLSNTRRNIIILLVILFATIFTFVLIFHKNRINLKNAEIGLKVSDASKLSHLLQISETENTQIKNQLESLFRAKFETINKLCNKYFDLESTKTQKTELFKAIQNELNEITSPKNLEQISEMVNLTMDQIMHRLDQQIPTLKQNDRTFILLSYAGFSPRAICLCTDIKLGHYYVKRKRLKALISSSQAPDKDDFIDKLG